MTKFNHQKKLISINVILVILFSCFAFNSSFCQNVPVTTDSRIRTLVYNPNEVYQLKFYYGYQSFIEFSEDEEIEMISVGERKGVRTPIRFSFSGICCCRPSFCEPAKNGQQIAVGAPACTVPVRGAHSTPNILKPRAAFMEEGCYGVFCPHVGVCHQRGSGHCPKILSLLDASLWRNGGVARSRNDWRLQRRLGG